MSGIWLLSYLLLWALVAVLILLVVGMLRQIGQLQMKTDPEQGVLVTDDGLPLAEPAPAFEAREAFEDRVVSFPPGRRKAVVIFLSTTCQPCYELVPHLNGFWEKERSSYEFYIICSGSREQVREFARLYNAVFPMVYDADGEIVQRFQHRRTPYAYLVDEHGIVRMKGVVNEEKTLRALIQLRGTRRDEEAWQLTG